MTSADQKSVQTLTELSELQPSHLGAASRSRKQELMDSLEDFGRWEDIQSCVRPLQERANRMNLQTGQRPLTLLRKQSTELPKPTIIRQSQRTNTQISKAIDISRRIQSTGIDLTKSYPPRLQLTPLSLGLAEVPRLSESGRFTAHLSRYKKKRLSECRPKLGPTILLTHILSTPNFQGQMRKVRDGWKLATAPPAKE